MKRIIIDLIVSNNCNKKCEYCFIKFDGKELSFENIDYLINYLKKYSLEYDSCLINFFGGEPLLNFEAIKYFIKNNNNKKISYSIGTNGFLLNKEISEFLKDNHVKIILSYHDDNQNTYESLLKKTFLLEHKDLEINFIIAPNNILESYNKIDKLINANYKKINIIPVMMTMNWSKNEIKQLGHFINYVDTKYIKNPFYKNISISKYSFFDGIINEKVFVVDYNLDIFQDSSDELYISKYYDMLGKELLNEIKKKTFLGNLKDSGSDFGTLIKNHSIKDIFKLIYKLPKKMGYVQDYYLIYKIMNKDKKDNDRLGNMIFGVNE